MKSHKNLYSQLCLVLLALAVCSYAQAEEILISAAASLKDVMGAATPLFEKANPGTKLTFNYGASGQLKMQIESGAPADLFISAAMNDMDALETKGLVIRESRNTVAKNTLVLIRNSEKKVPLTKTVDLTLSSVTKISIGNPATVPAGRYAKETLEKLGLFEKIKDKLIFAENVRQVLDYVARGEVDAGFVYKTDAMTESKVQVIETISANLHQPIQYPAVALKNGKNTPLAKRFIEFLKSAEGIQVFHKYGFK